MKQTYQTGFGNFFESEAEANSLPIGQNSPQKPLNGLYPELLSGSAFTMPREQNLRTWMYKILPSVKQSKFNSVKKFFLQEDFVSTPEQLRWSKPRFTSGTFLDNLSPVAHNPGCSIWNFSCDKNMTKEYFYNSDGEMLIVIQYGQLELFTELGILKVEPQEIAVIPRGVKFKVLTNTASNGYICENLASPFKLPDLGPIGSNGLANPRDFMYPVASYEKNQGNCVLYNKFCNELFSCELIDSPLNSVAWHGNYCPYKYNLRRFNTMNTVSYDHADPSIFTVLTSPTDTPGKANIDFVIFPPRWLVAEDSFRPPYYHRNIMNEFMGLIEGQYDAKPGGFEPGGYSLHNCMSSHGPDSESFEKAVMADLKPEKYNNTMAFMFESSFIFKPHKDQLAAENLQKDYLDCWQNLKVLF